MNPTVPPFAGAKPVLKLPRRGAAAGSETSVETETAARWQIADELAEMRRREANLAEYESRLRVWQSQLDAQSRSRGETSNPFIRPAANTMADDPVLTSAWGRLYRARELLEAEQRQMRDDRIAHRDAELALKRREAELDAREARLTERERAVEATLAGIEARKVGAVVRRLTRAPFVAAKTMFKSA